MNTKTWNIRRDNIPPHVLARMNEAAMSPPPAIGLRFSKSGAFRGIRLDQALKLLLEDEESFLGHKKIIFKALCAWMMDSADFRASRDATVIATAKTISDAENSKRMKSVPATARYLMQGLPKYRPLFQTIFYPIGGFGALTKAYAVAEARAKKRRKAGKEIVQMTTLLEIFAFHERYLTKEKQYGYPSVERAIKVTAALDKAAAPQSKRGKPPRKDTVVREFLRRHSKAVAFLYCASFIELEDGRSLLDCLISGKLSLKDVTAPSRTSEGSVLEEWLSFTKSFTDNVVPLLRFGRKRFAPVAIHISRQHPVRQYTDEQQAIIKGIFAEKNDSGARLQF